MESSKSNASAAAASNPNPVQVLTAGGVVGKKKRRRNKKKAAVVVANGNDSEGSSSSTTPSVSSVRLNQPDSRDEGGVVDSSLLQDVDDDDTEEEEVTTTVDDLYASSQPLDETRQMPSPNSTESSSSTGGTNNAASELTKNKKASELVWLAICFFGIMFSFVVYGLLLEYTTSGGRHLHELSFLFVTSSLYTLTAAAGRHVRDETPTTIPPARFALLGLTSMGSTFCSVRSLRYVIYPIQVLAKSCKPVPVMLMGALMGKKYPFKKYINVALIVTGVALFMGGGGGGGKNKHDGNDADKMGPSQLFGILLLFVSLCFDGGTGAYEDKLMAVHSVGPFDLMYNIQLGKTILAGVGLLVLNQVHVFLQMCQDMGFLLVALGLSGALGQVFIFVTISKFGALTCSIIGLARKVTTLVASIYFYGHFLNSVQFTGLVICIGAMVLNFWGKKGKGGGGHGAPAPAAPAAGPTDEERQGLMAAAEEAYHDDVPSSSQAQEESKDGDVEMGPVTVQPEVTLL